MNITLISPRSSLISAVAGGLRGQEKDFSRNWVVFPEKRPAYYLRKTLALSVGSSFIPPKIDSLDTFVEDVYSRRLGSRNRAIDVIDAVALLFEIHRGAAHPLGSGQFLSADQFFSLGIKLYQDLEELKAEGVQATALANVDRWEDETLGEGTARRLQSLSYFYERFYEIVRERGYSTPASRVEAVSRGIEATMFIDIDAFVFAGFFTLTKTEQALLETVLSWDISRLILLKGRGVDELIGRLHLAKGRPPNPAEEPEPLPDLELTSSADTHGQIYALNKALEDRLKDPRLLNEEQVVVLPSAETLFPLFQQTLSPLSESDFNISLGYPLSRTPIYSFFDKLLELVQTRDEEGRIYVPDYLRFVLHPYAKNIFFPGPEKRADLTRILFHAIEEVLTERRTKSFWSLSEIEDDAGIRDRVQDLIRNVDAAPVIAAFIDHLRSIHARTFRLFARIENVGDFAEKLIRVLTYIYENSTARLHYFFHPYAEAFLSSLEALSRSLLGDTVFDDPTSYFNLFRKVISSGTVPFFGTPLRGLQVLGFWETRGIPFKDVHILDVNEGVLPPGRTIDSLIPLGARAALDLPTYRKEEIGMEYCFDTLIRGADRVHLYFVENSEKEKSRFAEKLIWELQKRDRNLSTEKYVETVRYDVSLQTEKPRSIEKTETVMDFLKHFTYSATSLDMYLRCPLRFYFTYVLNLKEPDEISESMDRKDIGIIVHAILEDYFKKFKGRSVSEQDLSFEGLARTMDRNFEKTYGKDAAGGAYWLKLQIQRHLADFLRDYQAPLIKRLKEEKKRLHILSLEDHIQAERAVAGTALRLKAKVDRIESRGDDIFILDYKTSSSTKHLDIKFGKLHVGLRETWATAVSSLQLPLYHWIYAQARACPRERIYPLFLMLGKARLGPEIEFSPYVMKKGEDALREERIDAMEKLIAALLEEIIDPKIPFEPCPKTVGICALCPFCTFCDRR